MRQQRFRSRPPRLESLEPRLPCAVDLDPLLVSAPPSAESAGRVNVLTAIGNRGNTPSVGYEVAYYLSTDSVITPADTLLSWTFRPGVAGPGIDAWLESVPLPAVAGKRWIGAIVDRFNDTLESNENNNRQVDPTPLEVLPPPPDLAGSFFTHVAAEPHWGSEIPVFAQVRNQGAGSAGAFSVSFYLSRDSDISTTDYLLGSQTVSGLAPGQAFAWDELALRLPSIPPAGFALAGEVHLGLIVDPLNRVAELDEANNRNRGDGLDRAALLLAGNAIEGRIAVAWPGGRHLPAIDVSLERVAGDVFGDPVFGVSLQPNMKTWVVIHGRSDGPASFHELAAAVDRYQPGDQVLVLDWSAGAADNHPVGLFLDGAEWIPHVSQWAAGVLQSLAIDSGELLLVGHSWGSFVAYEIAQRIPALERLVALDPAAAASGYAYQFVNFAAATARAWAFYGGQAFGSAALAGTADEAFLLQYQTQLGQNVDAFNAHQATRLVFETLVRQNYVEPGPVSPRASLFALNWLENPPLSPRFAANAYGGLFEGVFTLVDDQNDDEWGDLWADIAQFRYRRPGAGEVVV